MTADEFLAALGQIGRWRFSNTEWRIRLSPGPYIRTSWCRVGSSPACPVMAVWRLQNVGKVMPHSTLDAAKELGLRIDVAESIIAAADNWPPFMWSNEDRWRRTVGRGRGEQARARVVRMRKRLLKACRMEEK